MKRNGNVLLATLNTKLVGFEIMSFATKRTSTHNLKKESITPFEFQQEILLGKMEELNFLL